MTGFFPLGLNGRTACLSFEPGPFEILEDFRLSRVALIRSDQDCGSSFFII